MASFFSVLEKNLSTDLGDSKELGAFTSGQNITDKEKYFKQYKWIVGSVKIDILLEMLNEVKGEENNVSPVHKVLLTSRILDSNENIIFKDQNLLMK